jgi:photosynthetic reaction center cytochrome c subunit
MNFRLGMTIAIVAVLIVGVGLTLERPPVESVQRGYRGLGMVQVYNPRDVAHKADLNRIPESFPRPAPSGKKASQVYTNVKVLGDVDSDEFVRLMAAITEWVSPVQGCAYCHKEGEEFSADTLYTKTVSRRMLEMTRFINTTWKAHVADTGVTCYTCHRGNPVPRNIWFHDSSDTQALSMVGNRAGQNTPSPGVGFTSLPYDPFTAFLQYAEDIRVVSNTALPEGSRRSIKQTEGTYALMMHMSEALGVNCTYCHNTRSFMSWDQSSPQRATTWHGIRMVRALNMTYLEPLRPEFPAARLGPLGDAPKVNCTSCHQGSFKPLYGASMLTDFPELGATPGEPAQTQPPPPPIAPPQPQPQPQPQPKR